MTLVIVSSVPIAICMTLAAMYLLGYSLNILSMMGLLLAVGMLIDNAVVVTESVLQEKQLQKSDPTYQKTKAGGNSSILNGVDKVSLAVLAGTLTTAIVFLPNIFGVKVELTIFLEHVAIAICISLAASLLVAKTLLPLMLSKMEFNLPEKVHKSKLQQRYLNSLKLDTMARPKTSGVIALILLGSTALPLSMVKQDQSDGEGNNRLYINYQVEGRHSLDVTEKMIDKMEDYLYANQDKFNIDSVYSYFSADRGQSTLLLKEDIEIDMKALKKMIREGFPKICHRETAVWLGWRKQRHSHLVDWPFYLRAHPYQRASDPTA